MIWTELEWWNSVVNNYSENGGEGTFPNSHEITNKISVSMLTRWSHSSYLFRYKVVIIKNHCFNEKDRWLIFPKQLIRSHKGKRAGLFHLKLFVATLKYFKPLWTTSNYVKSLWNNSKCLSNTLNYFVLFNLNSTVSFVAISSRHSALKLHHLNFRTCMGN